MKIILIAWTCKGVSFFWIRVLRICPALLLLVYYEHAWLPLYVFHYMKLGPLSVNLFSIRGWILKQTSKTKKPDYLAKVPGKNVTALVPPFFFFFVVNGYWGMKKLFSDPSMDAVGDSCVIWEKYHILIIKGISMINDLHHAIVLLIMASDTVMFSLKCY